MDYDEFLGLVKDAFEELETEITDHREELGETPAVRFFMFVYDSEKSRSEKLDHIENETDKLMEFYTGKVINPEEGLDLETLDCLMDMPTFAYDPTKDGKGIFVTSWDDHAHSWVRQIFGQPAFQMSLKDTHYLP